MSGVALGSGLGLLCHKARGDVDEARVRRHRDVGCGTRGLVGAAFEVAGKRRQYDDVCSALGDVGAFGTRTVSRGGDDDATWRSFGCTVDGTDREGGEPAAKPEEECFKKAPMSHVEE